MSIPTLFSMGFGATALSTQPAISTLVLIIIDWLFETVQGRRVHALAIFFGALCASLLGKTQGWRAVEWEHQNPLLLLGLAACYLWALASRSQLFGLFLLTCELERRLLSREEHAQKTFIHVGLLFVCELLLDPADGEAHILACVVTAAICFAYTHGKAVWTTLKNAIFL